MHARAFLKKVEQETRFWRTRCIEYYFNKDILISVFLGLFGVLGFYAILLYLVDNPQTNPWQPNPTNPIKIKIR